MPHRDAHPVEAVPSHRDLILAKSKEKREKDLGRTTKDENEMIIQ